MSIIMEIYRNWKMGRKVVDLQWMKNVPYGVQFEKRENLLAGIETQ